MPLVTTPTEVEEIYAEARQCISCIPAFGVEHPTAIEAILSGVKQVAEEYNISSPPIIIAFTGNYAPRPQLRYYTTTHSAKTGLRMLLSDVKVLLEPDALYSNLRVMLHFDHAQPGTDNELIELALPDLASIMYDASTLSLTENAAKTAEFVERTQRQVKTEGAIDQIAEAGRGEHPGSTITVDQVEDYVRKTGVFLIVPDLGTEHRASTQEIVYLQNKAHQIRNRVGSIICLHGTSSLQEEHLVGLAADGVAKVNIWTTTEIVGGKAVVQDVLSHQNRILEQPNLAYITDIHRREVWAEAVSQQVVKYCRLLGYEYLAK